MGSKPIEKADDSAKEFVIKALQGDETHGFDLDSIYSLKTPDGRTQYIIFEFLKCDSEKVTPLTSEPARYPYNWRKFVRLFNISRKLDAKLFLVNYSDRPIDKNEIKVMLVKDIDFNALEAYDSKPRNARPKYLDYIKYENVVEMTFEQFSDFLRNINHHSSMCLEK